MARPPRLLIEQREIPGIVTIEVDEDGERRPPREDEITALCVAFRQHVRPADAEEVYYGGPQGGPMFRS